MKLILFTLVLCNVLLRINGSSSSSTSTSSPISSSSSISGPTQADPTQADPTQTSGCVKEWELWCQTCDFPGTELIQWGVQNLDQCKEKCNEDAQCVGIDWYEKQKKCWANYDLPTTQDVPGDGSSDGWIYRCPTPRSCSEDEKEFLLQCEKCDFNVQSQIEWGIQSIEQCKLKCVQGKDCTGIEWESAEKRCRKTTHGNLDKNVARSGGMSDVWVYVCPSGGGTPKELSSTEESEGPGAIIAAILSILCVGVVLLIAYKQYQKKIYNSDTKQLHLRTRLTKNPDEQLMNLTGTWTVAFHQEKNRTVYGIEEKLTEYKVILNQEGRRVTGGSPDNGSTVEGEVNANPDEGMGDVFTFHHNLGPKTFNCRCVMQACKERLKGKWQINDRGKDLNCVIEFTREERKFDPYRPFDTPLETEIRVKTIPELKTTLIESSMNQQYCKKSAIEVINKYFGEQQADKLSAKGLKHWYPKLWNSSKNRPEVLLGLLLLEQSKEDACLAEYTSSTTKMQELRMAQVVTELLTNYAPGLQKLLTKMENHEGITNIVTFKPGKIGFSHKHYRIVAVIRETQAAALGIKVGWTIKEIDGVPQTNGDEEIERRIKDHEEKDRDNKPLTITFLLTIIEKDALQHIVVHTFQDDIKAHDSNPITGIDDEVKRWMDTLELTKYKKDFRANERLTMNYFLNLEEKDLNDMLADLGFQRVEKKMIKRSLEVYRWLVSLHQESYFLEFERYKYNEMSFIHCLNAKQVEKMLSLVECSPKAKKAINDDLKCSNSDHTNGPQSFEDEVIEWIMHLNLQRYAMPLRDGEYLTMSHIRSLDKRKLGAMMEFIDCTESEERKIIKNLQEYGKSPEDSNVCDVNITNIPMNEMVTSDIMLWLKCLGLDDIANVIKQKNVGITEFEEHANSNFSALGINLTGKNLTLFKKSLYNLQKDGYTKRQWFDQYEIIRPLGTGNFGITYLVKKENDLFALKHLLARNAKEAKEAEKEITALKSIDSPNVISFDSSFQTSQGVAIVVQFCEDGCLQDLIDRGPIPPEQGTRLLNDIANGLDAFHSRGMIHRDIKPDNLLLHNGMVLIGDLGLSRNLSNGNYLSTVGYLYYLAPEIERTKCFTPSTDIWSFGCVLLTMISGKNMEDRTPCLFLQPQEKINEIVDEGVGKYCSTLGKIGRRCLTIQPDERPHTDEIVSILSDKMRETKGQNFSSKAGACSEPGCSCGSFVTDKYVASHCEICSHSDYKHK